jgi:hypothetical protein
MRALLDRQMRALRDIQQLAAQSAATQRDLAGARPPLTARERTRFAPAAPEALHEWIDDGLVRAQATEASMRCPSTALVYATEHALECAIPAAMGSVPQRHGLSLGFYASTGRLSHQRYYEHGLLRWAIEYHASGGRSTAGRYSGEERLEYREDGLHTRWAPNGTVVAQTEWADGVRHGWSRLWEPDGYPLVASRYERGAEVEVVRPGDAEAATAEAGATARADGLKASLVVPPAPARLGETVTVRLVFENESAEPMRVYLVRSEPFRAHQCMFALIGPTGEPVGPPLPRPRAHGYVVTEADFHRLAPGESRAFEQTLRLDPEWVSPGSLTVAWTYSNEVTRMPGGIQTFDGVTQPLFGGGEIPGIWTGRLSTRARLTVAG